MIAITKLKTSFCVDDTKRFDRKDGNSKATHCCIYYQGEYL